ncbi:MAG: acyl-CoA dehydrogenase, partial [Pseudomonadota bacterium]|nr:acyl-CoA dehydrogenase [Pseudomonadota bacterium]
MNKAQATQATGAGAQDFVLPGLADLAREAVDRARALLAKATGKVSAVVTSGGKLSAHALEREQHMAHGLAWFATYVESI